jgi:hypothetical protein
MVSEDEALLFFMKRRWKVLIVCFVLVVGGMFAFRPAMSAFRSFRADRLLTDAREYSEKGDWGNCVRSSLASLQLKSSIEGLRLFFRGQRETRGAALLKTAAALAGHPEASVLDRAEVMKTFLDVGDLLNFTGLLRMLDRKDQEVPEVKFQIVRFLLARELYEQAVSVADAEGPNRRPASLDLLLVSQMIRSDRAEVRWEAFKRLSVLLEADDRSVALDSMRILASQTDERIKGGLAEKALKRFERDGDLEVKERFALLLFQVGTQVEARAEIVKKAMAQYQVDHLEALVEWLLRIGEAEHALALTDGVEKTLKIFGYREVGLRLLGRYDQLLSEFDSPPAEMSPVEVFSRRASVAKRLGMKAKEDEFWRKAFEFAELRPSENQYYRIAGIAGAAGAEDQQMAALARGIEHPLGLPPEANKLGRPRKCFSVKVASDFC